MAALVDTNVLVYRFDSRDLLRGGVYDGSLLLPYQAIVEFYAAVTRPIRGFGSILSSTEATRETEELLVQFTVLYPTEQTVRAAMRAAAAYQLSWFDAGMWAYAETNGVPELITEDFQHGRYYGGVQTINPFR